MDPLLLAFQLLLVVGFAPLLQGLIKASKARWQMRRGPGILQPYRDLSKLLARESVASEQSSWVFAWAPWVYAASTVTAALAIPTLSHRSALSGVADAIVVVGVLALGRFAIALAALDTGSNFGGMGASREVTFAALIEPAIVLVVFTLALPAGTTNLTALSSTSGHDAARALAFGALLIAVISETGRVPIDNPDTHLELTMAHEGMVLEYSGRPLGIIFWASQIKQLVFLALMSALFFPWGLANEGDHALTALALGLATFVIKVALLGLLLGAIESAVAKLRIFRAPDLIGFASVLGLLAVLAAYVVER